MAENSKNLHTGHRQRVRDKFIADGNLDSFADHNILEFLLFYSVPRADTNEIAHELINKFGSLKGVLDAPFEALTEVKGVGENSAVLIRLITAMRRVYDGLLAEDIRYIHSTDDAVKYLKPKFTGLRNEALVLLCMNNSGKVLNCPIINEGGIDYTQVDVRKILLEVLNSNATDVIIAHNHPGGVCVPSRGDIQMTQMIAQTLTNTGTILRNHLIFSENGHYSFADNPKTRNDLKPEKYNILLANEDKEEQ